MQLENYFEFLTPYDIRLKGTRIGIETILYEYIYHHQSPETIANIYTNLTLEQIYATILYFLQNQEEITQYMTDWLNYCKESEKQQNENPPEYILRLRQIKAEREKIL
ncbi:DUF433 domain-containing protein [Lyngbya sp. CCY1209]|jgi:uncharacterized protein (DUF433 family)|uniref:DUF433 domain-containing protein n=1 Tax=Lyngbya sp. CCY1209 TaxID=2886103 RepID=UPI002D1FD1D8|nr:DUF433 domain-containing protein [Lyngbya sp. CCY1209]MEB3883535.1 DUF433 domain-containing protein [Lyngbya sp. CCY1209]